MKYRIVEVRDAEGRYGYQLAAEGEEPAGRVYSLWADAADAAGYYKQEEADRRDTQ